MNKREFAEYILKVINEKLEKDHQLGTASVLIFEKAIEEYFSILETRHAILNPSV